MAEFIKSTQRLREVNWLGQGHTACRCGGGFETSEPVLFPFLQFPLKSSVLSPLGQVLFSQIGFKDFRKKGSNKYLFCKTDLNEAGELLLRCKKIFYLP